MIAFTLRCTCEDVFARWRNLFLSLAMKAAHTNRSLHSPLSLQPSTNRICDGSRQLDHIVCEMTFSIVLGRHIF